MIKVHFKDGSEKTFEHCTRLPPSFDSEVVVVRLDASGEELSFIRHRFQNIPDAQIQRSVSWFGDWARFIAQNFW